MNKIAIASLIVIIVTAIVVYVSPLNDVKEEDEEDIFQGPVRPSDDLEHFRKTGITREVNHG